MARINFCPVCGERMIVEAKTNAAGDALERWTCVVNNDYTAEWDITSLAPGTTDLPVAAGLQENPVAREATAARQADDLRTLLADLAVRVGPVTPGASLVEEMRRVYSAVDTLELTAGNIALNADAINLNTDTLETLTTSTNTRIGDPGDPDTYDTLIGRVKYLIGLVGQAEVNRDTDATAAQARLDALATEATLANTRDTITAKNEDIRALLALQPTLAQIQNERQLSESLLQRRARQAASFMSSSGRLTLSVAGNLRSVITNPAGSGRRLYVHQIAVSASNGPAWADVIVNPTTGVPTITRPISSAFVGGPASIAQVAADTNTTVPLSGGVHTGIVYGIFAGRTQIDLPSPIIMSPGVSMGFNVPFAGATDMAFTIYFWEEAI